MVEFDRHGRNRTKACLGAGGRDLETADLGPRSALPEPAWPDSCLSGRVCGGRQHTTDEPSPGRLLQEPTARPGLFPRSDPGPSTAEELYDTFLHEVAHHLEYTEPDSFLADSCMRVPGRMHSPLFWRILGELKSRWAEHQRRA